MDGNSCYPSAAAGGRLFAGFAAMAAELGVLYELSAAAGAVFDRRGGRGCSQAELMRGFLGALRKFSGAAFYLSQIQLEIIILRLAHFHHPAAIILNNIISEAQPQRQAVFAKVQGKIRLSGSKKSLP